MNVVGVIRNLWLIQNAVGFVCIIKWHITSVFVCICIANGKALVETRAF